MRVVFRVLLFFLCSVFSTNLIGQDEEGCKDHKLFNRLKNFRIVGCSESFNEKEFEVANGKTETKEGTLMRITYAFNDDDPNLKPPSPIQVIRNYETAVQKNGGTKLYSSSTGDNDNGFVGATFKFSTTEGNFWMTITNFGPGGNEICTYYDLFIMKIEAMEQEIRASEMLNKLNAGENLTLYINFETGKADIKEESLPVVNEIYNLLNENPALRIAIEGHTDNTGNKASNQELSAQRAASVKSAIIKKGIAASRIETAGFGQDVPIADNRNEEGRAKNRRVEIRKL